MTVAATTTQTGPRGRGGSDRKGEPSSPIQDRASKGPSLGRCRSVGGKDLPPGGNHGTVQLQKPSLRLAGSRRHGSQAQPLANPPREGTGLGSPAAPMAPLRRGMGHRPHQLHFCRRSEARFGPHCRKTGPGGANYHPSSAMVWGLDPPSQNIGRFRWPVSGKGRPSGPASNN